MPLPGPVVALVPVRSPGVGKTRLARRLDRAQRAALSGAMLADVVGVLRCAPVDRVVVAAAGAEAAAAAAALDVDVLLDPPGSTSLDAALSAAISRLGTVGALLVVTADLPQLTARDVTAVLDAPVAVAVAATDDGGTGGLLRRPPAVITTAYGPGSAARHLRLATDAGVSAVSVTTAGFRQDVDTWTDVVALHGRAVGPSTARVLATLDDATRQAG